MNAFGALLWAASCGGLILLFGVLLAVNGLGPDGWQRTGRFYIDASLLTLPLPLVLLARSGAPAVGGPWVVAAAMRQIVCLPLFVFGMALAGLSAWQKRPSAALIITALLNIASFTYLYFSGV